MTDNILFYYLGKNKTFCLKFSVSFCSFWIKQGKLNFVKYMNRFNFKIELLIDYYPENFEIQVIFGDYTAFSIVLE